MNATERLVENYFRHCHQCFTLTDVKVDNGNNRQLDLLAYQPTRQQYLHVEVSVTHSLRWTGTLDDLVPRMEKKFFGAPSPRSGNSTRTDIARGKNYQAQIAAIYERYEATWPNVLRVWCLWHYPSDPALVTAWQQQLAAAHPEIAADRFRVLSFRNEVLPRLSAAVGSKHHEDELLRVLSLQEMRLHQIGPDSPTDQENPYRFVI